TYSGLCGLVPAEINADKINELVVDFCRHSHSMPAPVNIQGTNIVIVKSYRYLSVHLNNNLDWTDNTDALVKMGWTVAAQEAEAIFYGIVCWASSITGQGQEENGQTGEEGQLCPGITPWIQWR
ncbi:hypothetical protein L3Q82_022889, partial [Scortum barcoo]